MGIFEHVGAQLLACDSFVALFATYPTGLWRLVRALGDAVALLFAVAASASEWMLDALVGATGFVVADVC